MTDKLRTSTHEQIKAHKFRTLHAFGLLVNGNSIFLQLQTGEIWNSNLHACFALLASTVYMRLIESHVISSNKCTAIYNDNIGRHKKKKNIY